ncbi:ATPase [Colletotrichum sublineola]|uniref:Putative ATPase n=1 Tax=Colletotrichum sublineola TaxID=1173701 RepID=A0A066XMT4_COLSU|nr:ATPase [Colletotrichum sublineola]KDN67310.1 putative ATPase [Colletotrichum sublineola]
MESGTRPVSTAAAPIRQAKSSVSTNYGKKKSPKEKVKNPSKRKGTKHNKHARHGNDSSTSSTEDDSHQFVNDGGSSDSESLSSNSEDEPPRRKTKLKRHSEATKVKKTRSIASRSTRKGQASKKRDVSPPSSSSSSDSDSDSSSDDDDDEDANNGLVKVSMTPQQRQSFQQWQRNNGALPHGGNNAPASWPPPLRRGGSLGLGDAGLGENPMYGNGTRRKAQAAPPSSKKNQQLDFKRVDQVWDSAIHQYKLQDTAVGSSNTQYDGYVLQIRRTFDWEGKYKTTVVDVKSKILRESLQEVMGNIKGVSLVDETPKVDPNMLFLYLEDFRKFYKKLKKTVVVGASKKERKKHRKQIETKRQHLKVLLKYLDKDYAHVKKSLYPMLDNGLITFDLLWALFKPNTLVYTATYGTPDEPRIFKAEQAEKLKSITKGELYVIDGKYLEFDGRQFGYGTLCEEILEFRGARKITSLSAFPLDFHKDKESIKAALINRGKKFVQLGGVHYRCHHGLAYYKKKKTVIKVNVNSRVMVDPAIHRRINPNYQVSVVRPKDHDVLSDSEDSDEENPCGQDSDSDNGSDNDACGKMVTKVVRDAKGNVRMVQVPKSDLEDSTPAEKLEQVNEAEDESTSGASRQGGEKWKEVPVFSDEDYLIASSIVLGFSFSEKLWLEFTVSGIDEIHWNEGAYESLVLESKQKDIVKALVESHRYHAAESIDDVIQGKGKGLVAVLHGPPGTGKTLTAEGISELLKCPLYMASAGELGTDSRYLEAELQKILDICHAWGAILLLDEADVFLEKRNLHEIARNALVSIFLRQLEYFQGILFLTTNRVETFDDAFQSRIHIALRYDSLNHRAKKSIFKIFVERVRVLEKVDLKPFSDEDYDNLAKHNLNGRQIKNTVRTAQALAVNKSQPLSMEHIRQVLDVQNSFDLHLKGGESYKDAMRSYY